MECLRASEAALPAAHLLTGITALQRREKSAATAPLVIGQIADTNLSKRKFNAPPLLVVVVGELLK